MFILTNFSADFSYCLKRAMAKSQRSKIKRKFRAVKRHKLRPKTDALLKKVLSVPVGGTGLPYVDAKTMPIVEVVPKEQGMLVNVSLILRNLVMETETKKKKLPPLMNEHGNYPVWMNKKEMKRHISRRKRIQRNKKKTTKK